MSFNDARRTAGNTNDYNGKMLRFNPIENLADGSKPAIGPGTTYSLPTAASPNGPNLFDGTEGGGGKTNPEIYARQGGLDCPLSTVMKLAAVPTRLKDYGDPMWNALVNWGYAISDKSIRRWYRDDLMPASTWPQPGGL